MLHFNLESTDPRISPLLLPLLFSCHPSPKAEDLLLPWPFLLNPPQTPEAMVKGTDTSQQTYIEVQSNHRPGGQAPLAVL